MKWSIVFFALLLSEAVNAQAPTGLYMPLPNCKVKKQQVSIPEELTTGQDAVWDFRDLTMSERKFIVKYSEWNDSIVAETERGTRFYYQSTPTALLLYGYENNTTCVSYDHPELILNLPLEYGKKWQRFFHGTAIHGDKVFMRQFGSSSVEVDGTGVMLLPEGDTLRFVSRVHIQETAVEQHFPMISTAENLRAMTDSISPFTEDSIRQHLVKDSLLTETNIYRWYAVGYRYPIMEMITVGAKGAAPHYTFASYCAPDEQNTIDDSENEDIRKWLAQIDHLNYGAISKNSSSSASIANNSLIKNVGVNVSGPVVHVCYDLTAEATVKVLLCNVQGMVLRQSSRHDSSGTGYELQLNSVGLSHGQYVLYLNVDGEIISHTVNI